MRYAQVRGSKSVPRKALPSNGRKIPDRVVASCLIAGLAIITVGWAFGNPPGASPDEPSALIKALATAHFELSGKSDTAPLPSTPSSGIAWITKATRSYALPARETPLNLSVCMAFHPNRTARCLLQPSSRVRSGVVQAATPDGVYPPFIYLPLGLAARLATSLTAAFYAARLASAVLSLLLLAAAARCAVVGRRTLWPAAGLALATTPMVIFLDASVTTNGVEVAAAICFWAGLLRARQADAPKVVWLATGAGGAIMALSRQLDVAWLVTGVILFVGLLGPRRAFERFRGGGRYSILALSLLGCGGIAGLAWDVFATPRQPVSLTTALNNRPTLDHLGELAHEAIGIFGWLDTPLPTSAEGAWVLGILTLACLAVVFGNARQRLALIGTILAIAAATIGVQMFVMAQIGFGMQMRYVLAMAVALPLLAAEIIAECDGQRSELKQLRRLMLFFVMLVVSVVQWVGYYTNAHRYGVGLNSPRSLLTQAEWQPPGGTTLWLAVTATGAACLAVTGILMGISSGDKVNPRGAEAQTVGTGSVGGSGAPAHRQAKPLTTPRTRAVTTLPTCSS